MYISAVIVWDKSWDSHIENKSKQTAPKNTPTNQQNSNLKSFKNPQKTTTKKKIHKNKQKHRNIFKEMGSMGRNVSSKEI